MKSFRELFSEHEGNLIDKWDHYFEIYDKYFTKYRHQPVNILEIGISHGGSLQLWRKYFGEQARIFAMDINEDCRKLGQPNTTIFIGSQTDPVFLDKLAEETPMFDIIIDDGGHTMAQQKTTIEHLFRKVKDGGIYLVEDTHTSYWHEFHGGYKNKNSFIEYSKNFIDALHEWHVHDGPAIPSNDIMRNVNCISFYDSIVVFEKGERKKPFTVQRGHKTITPYVDPTLQKLSLAKQIQKKFYQLTRKKEA
jgi:ubiquinone/menaquinone biosynthesis C-methylase UbiE